MIGLGDTIAFSAGGAAVGLLEGELGEAAAWAVVMGGAHRFALSAAQDEFDRMHGRKAHTPKQKRCWS